MFSRKWWKRILIGAAVAFVLGLLGFTLLWNSTRARGERLRDAAVARLDLEDPCWQSVDLTTARNAKLPPPSQNAGEQTVQVFTLLPASYRDWNTKTNWRGDLKPGVLPHEDDLCEAAGVLSDCDDALKLARAIREMPQGGLPFAFAEPNPNLTLLSNTQNVREVGSLLDWDALLLASQNQPNDAIRSCHALLNLGRGAIGDEPLLISQLVRLATASISVAATQRTLGLGEPTIGLAELQAALLQEIAEPRLTYAFRGERACSFRLLENFDNGLITLADVYGRPNTIDQRLAQPLMKQHTPAQQAKLLELFGACLAADKLTGPERKAAFAAVKLPPRGGDTLLIYQLMPMFDKVANAETRIRSQLACAAVGLACERYRLQFGKWPESLTAIPKDILPTLPLDAYTGQALLYAKFDDGIAVYTTGEDLTDDKAANLDPNNKPGCDLGFRLFNPDQRRREPPPKPTEPTDQPDDQ